MWDVVIVGAGPAGATAGIELSRKGKKVLLIDKESFPRDKVCGDALIADSLRCLSRIGLLSEVEDRGKIVSRLSYYSPSGIRVDTESRMITLRRLYLDNIIVQGAIEAGSEFMVGKVLDVTQDSSCVFIQTAGSSNLIEAKVCIIATGAHVTLGKKLGIVRDVRANGAAVRCYVKSPIDLDRLIFSYDKDIVPAYGWIFPLPGGEINIGCGVFRNKLMSTESLNLPYFFNRFTNTFPLAKEIMERSTYKTSLIGMPLRCGFAGVKSPRNGRIISIGESISTTFPFSGEGIGKAMESGEIAAGVIGEYLSSNDIDRLSRFERLIFDKLESKYVGYRKAERWLSNIWFNDLLARRAQKNKFIRECMVGLLEEKINPIDFFSLKGVFNYLMRSSG